MTPAEGAGGTKSVSGKSAPVIRRRKMPETYEDQVQVTLQTVGAYLLWCNKIKRLAMPDNMLTCLCDEDMVAEHIEYIKAVGEVLEDEE
jgi:hypothetical protein